MRYVNSWRKHKDGTHVKEGPEYKDMTIVLDPLLKELLWSGTASL